MTNDEIYKRIIVMDSVKAANIFIRESNISKSDISKLCKRHNIFVDPKATKEELVSRFISLTLGEKLKKKASHKYHTK